MDPIQILVLLAIPILGTIKVLIQGMASKKGVNTLKDSLVFTGILFFSLAIFVAICFAREIPSTTTIILALINGAFNVIFQVCYIQAFKIGPVSISGTIANFSMLVPLMFGIIYLNEKVTPFKIAGIFFILVAFVLLTKKDKHRSFSIKWFILIISAFLAAGFTTSLQAFFKTTSSASQRNEYLVVNYLFATILCFVIALICKRKDKTTMVKNKYTIGGPILIGIVLGIYQVLVMFGLSIIDVSIYSPVTAALAVIFLLVSSIFVFKDRPTLIQYIGITIGVIGVIMVNL